MNLTVDDILDRIKEICLWSGFEDYELYDSMDKSGFAVTLSFIDEDDPDADWSEVSVVQEFDYTAEGKLCKPYFEFRNGSEANHKVFLNLFTMNQVKGLMEIADLFTRDVVLDALIQERSELKYYYEDFEGEEDDTEVL